MSKWIRTGWWAASIATAILCLSSTASAQGWGDPEAGDTGEWQPPPEQQQPPQQQPPQQPPPQQQPPQQPPPQQQQQQQQWFQQGDQETPPGMGGEQQPKQQGAEGESDHSQVVGAVGLGFFGLNTINMDPGFDAGMGPRTSGNTKVRPALIGIRMWFSESLGLDAAVGFAFRTRDRNNTSASGETLLVGGEDGVFGLDVHVGLPIAVKTWQHFSFLLVPEVDFGYAAGTILGQGPDERPTENDTDLTGLKFTGQLQLAGELQLGFLGVPQLGIQGGLSVGLNWVSETAEDVFAPGESDPPNVKTENSGIGLATGAHIRAVYYFN